ncbi:MAG: thermonuclease family protein [Chloroflexi bacterium]|nr:thermonuclease family protein [Chloroflexota bacterium]MBP8059880.1 thermonuclease family protein [Chloroflexota bacterium]
MTERRFSPFKLGLGALAGVMGFMCLCLMCVIALPTPTEPSAVDVVEVTLPIVAAADPAEPGYTRPTSTILTSSLPTTESGLAQTTAALAPAGEQALVVRVIDGDTIEVEIAGQNYRVRYIGMDTPERGDLFFQEATDTNARLVAGQTVTMVKDVSETDRYGRLLRYVYLADGTFVNAELVRQGYALVATYPPDVAHQELFVTLQQEARKAEVGLWGEQVAAASGPAIIEVVVTTEPVATLAPLGTSTSIPTLTPSPVPVATVLPTAIPVVTAVAAASEPTQPPAPSATAPSVPGAVVISYVFYDGQVTQVESDEYAEITNQGGSSVNLGGWRLNAGDAGQDFWFPAFELAPGQSCRVYTNEVHPETCGFSFDYGRAIWANSGECGYLYDQSGIEVSRYCYPS